MASWGRAGERLSVDEAEYRIRRRAVQRQSDAVRRQSDAVRRRERNDAAQPLWAAGQLIPYNITAALNAKGLFGPEVDLVCGAEEPDVDHWELGIVYPRWDQTTKLAGLCGVTIEFLCHPFRVLTVRETSLRLHLPASELAPTIRPSCVSSQRRSRKRHAQKASSS